MILRPPIRRGPPNATKSRQSFSGVVLSTVSTTRLGRGLRPLRRGLGAGPGFDPASPPIGRVGDLELRRPTTNEDHPVRKTPPGAIVAEGPARNPPCCLPLILSSKGRGRYLIFSY